jgi:hypothetical protein
MKIEKIINRFLNTRHFLRGSVIYDWDLNIQLNRFGIEITQDSIAEIEKALNNHGYAPRTNKNGRRIGGYQNKKDFETYN